MGDLAQSTWQKLLSLSPSVRYVEMVDDKLAVQSVGLLTELSIDDKSSYLSEAKRLHHLGAKGNRKATLLAQELWEKAAEAYSDDWTVKAYYGANLALVGRDSNDPQIMFGNGLKGLKIIKEALAQQGDNPEILRLKAMLLYSLPEAFFHFTNQSIKDFNTLIKLYKSNRNILSRQEYEEILYTLGLAYQRLGSKDQAQKVWAQLLNETSNQRYHKLINKGV
jgi:tetratricopeptide (TPR) repeat protein